MMFQVAAGIVTTAVSAVVLTFCGSTVTTQTWVCDKGTTGYTWIEDDGDRKVVDGDRGMYNMALAMDDSVELISQRAC